MEQLLRALVSLHWPDFVRNPSDINGVIIEIVTWLWAQIMPRAWSGGMAAQSWTTGCGVSGSEHAHIIQCNNKMASFTEPSNRMCRKCLVFHTRSFGKTITPIPCALQNEVDLCLNQDEWSRQSWVSFGKLEKKSWKNDKIHFLHAWFWQMQCLTYTFLYSIDRKSAVDHNCKG